VALSQSDTAMSSASPWDTTAWREFGKRPQYDRFRALPMSAPTAINPAAQSTILDRYAREPRRWNSEQTQSERPSLSVAHTDSTYPNTSYERHIPVSGGKYGPQQLTSTSPHHLPGQGAWRSLHHDDRREGTTINADAPLTLHIPKSHGTYKMAWSVTLYFTTPPQPIIDTPFALCTDSCRYGRPI